VVAYPARQSFLKRNHGARKVAPVTLPSPSTSPITSPEDPRLDDLCRALAQRAATADGPGGWPAESLRLCAEVGVLRWFMPQTFGGAPLGGLAWSDADLLRGYLRLSAACLTTTFILTQFTSACRRILDSQNEFIGREWLPRLLDGSSFATVGISHLTTSRRHLGKPALRATESPEGFTLDGFSPWVTGAVSAQAIVVGATLADGRQILALLPTDSPGVAVPAPLELVGLSGSCTGPVRCERVAIQRELLLAGPVENVMQGSTGARTGGLQTSALAIGHASGPIAFITEEATRRSELLKPLAGLRADQEALQTDLLALADGREVCTNESLRARANSLALRAAQSALAAAKGTGYVVGHPAGRWCREALFFLVWSCPQPVTAANL
jgi:alkylation response protein AidB-like acyl-CoA dehydrogenase